MKILDEGNERIASISQLNPRFPELGLLVSLPYAVSTLRDAWKPGYLDQNILALSPIVAIDGIYPRRSDWVLHPKEKVEELNGQLHQGLHSDEEYYLEDDRGDVDFLIVRNRPRSQNPRHSRFIIGDKARVYLGIQEWIQRLPRESPIRNTAVFGFVQEEKDPKRLFGFHKGLRSFNSLPDLKVHEHLLGFLAAQGYVQAIDWRDPINKDRIYLVRDRPVDPLGIQSCVHGRYGTSDFALANDTKSDPMLLSPARLAEGQLEAILF